MSNSEITLAPTSAADATGLADLRVLAMRESLEQVGRFDPVRARERLLQNFDARHTRHICRNGESVGFVVVRPSDFGHLLDHLCVHPDHQRQGIGSLALALVQREADQLGKALVVGALRDSGSNRFYLRHGFALLDQAQGDNYYVRPPQATLP